MFFPSEVLLEVLRDVSKKDLKAVRLVNKQWSSCTAKYLFDTLWISPHKENIDVFQSLTQHPVLRGCVTKLAVDGVEFFKDWTYAQYLDSVWDQTCQIRETNYWLKPLTSSDIQIKKFIELTRSVEAMHSDEFNKMLDERCSDFEFISTGYRKWQEHALYEQTCLVSDDFMRILVKGLQRVSSPVVGNIASLSPDPGHVAA